MSKQGGFTLLEVIFVLFVWSIIILLSAPLTLSVIENQQQKQFFETLQSDILLLQNMSIGSIENYRIVLYKDSYEIAEAPYGPMMKRELPRGWSIRSGSMPVLSFTNKGQIKSPGTFTILTKTTAYNVVFRFGKGREYIVEQ